MSVYRDLLLKSRTGEGQESSDSIRAGVPPSGASLDFERLVRYLEHRQESTGLSCVALSGLNRGCGTTFILNGLLRLLLLEEEQKVLRVTALAGGADDGSSFHFQKGEGNLDELFLPLTTLVPGEDRQVARRSISTVDLRKHIVGIKSRYKWIFMDLPPADQAEAVSWSTVADGLILVAESGVSRRERALAMVQHLREFNVDVLGVVLNKRKFQIPQWLYQKLFSESAQSGTAGRKHE
jgi:hypothetical protein